MEVIFRHTKLWQAVRDKAAESSAIIFVVNAEQTAKKLERLLKIKNELSATEIFDAFGRNMSGCQTHRAYQVLQCYWKYSYLLIWESFMVLWKEAYIQKLDPPKKFKRKKFHGCRRIKIH